MEFAVKLERFEGPLSLLLELIEAAKLDISEVSLARVTDAYLQRLSANPQIPPEEMADFLVVAAKLLYLKSRILLPFLAADAQEEIGDLESQLRIYKEYLDASKAISALIGKRRFLFVHDRLPQIEIGFAPPKKLTAAQMAEIMGGVLRRLDIVVRVPQAIIEKTVSIHEKIRQIQSFLARTAKSSFRALVASAESRIEVVVSFLALLELIRERAVVVNQDRLFDDITIEKTETETVSLPA
ncbi:MAG: ScpA family protein [Patescibacteria group bacterium]|jgi:segregation and condensation protein A